MNQSLETQTPEREQLSGVHERSAMHAEETE
jgi:hypothetical protein